jgi:hypothetical protein
MNFRAVPLADIEAYPRSFYRTRPRSSHPPPSVRMSCRRAGGGPTAGEGETRCWPDCTRDVLAFVMSALLIACSLARAVAWAFTWWPSFASTCFKTMPRSMRELRERAIEFVSSETAIPVVGAAVTEVQVLVVTSNNPILSFRCVPGEVARRRRTIGCLARGRGKGAERRPNASHRGHLRNAGASHAKAL